MAGFKFSWVLAILLSLCLFVCHCGPGQPPKARTNDVGASDSTFLLIHSTGGVFVGTVADPMKWKLNVDRIRWALSSDHRYLAVGRQVIDLQTGSIQQIPLPDVPLSAAFILRWSPTEPILGISFTEADVPRGELPASRSAFGYSFHTYDPKQAVLTEHANARIEVGFYWLKDGRSILYTQGARMGLRMISAKTASICRYWLDTKAVRQWDIAIQDRKKPIPESKYPVSVRTDLWFGFHSDQESINYPWHGAGVGMNPRTGETAMCGKNPDKLVIQAAGANTARTVATFKSEQFPQRISPFTMRSGGPLWRPRWLADDRHILITCYSGNLVVVDTTTGKWRKVMHGVTGCHVLDPDLRQMIVDKILKDDLVALGPLDEL